MLSGRFQTLRRLDNISRQNIDSIVDVRRLTIPTERRERCDTRGGTESRTRPIVTTTQTKWIIASWDHRLLQGRRKNQGFFVCLFVCLFVTALVGHDRVCSLTSLAEDIL